MKKKKQEQGLPKIALKQIRSAAGRYPNQYMTLKGLGLGKINKKAEVIDTPSIRGMIKTVQHLIVIE